MSSSEPMYMVVSRETDSIGIGTAYCIYRTRAEAARWQLAHGLRATTIIINCF